MTRTPSSSARLALAIVGCCVVFTLHGCGSSGGSGGSKPLSAQEQEALIQKIQNDPKIPAAAKEAAIASLRNPGGERAVAEQAARQNATKNDNQ